MNVITDPAQAGAAAAKLMRGRITLAVTGAGISTDSGLPDYRGTGSGAKPSVEFSDFVANPHWQRWVWQQNQATWKAVAGLKPTPGHLALTDLEKVGALNGIATQNIDALHTKAGSEKVWELHGSFTEVLCLDCSEVSSRERLDIRLKELNPELIEDPDPARVAILAAADVEAARACTFQTAPCEDCGGVLKPGVVFFGESLPGAAFDSALRAARQADVVLVAGTSLVVLTGLWVVEEALSNGAKLIIINRGPTAADDYADVRIEGSTSTVLPAVANLLDLPDPS